MAACVCRLRATVEGCAVEGVPHHLWHSHACYTVLGLCVALCVVPVRPCAMCTMQPSFGFPGSPRGLLHSASTTGPSAGHHKRSRSGAAVDPGRGASLNLSAPAGLQLPSHAGMSVATMCTILTGSIKQVCVCVCVCVCLLECSYSLFVCVCVCCVIGAWMCLVGFGLFEGAPLRGTCACPRCSPCSSCCRACRLLWSR